MKRSEFRYRQVHLDFHTSEHIPDVGAAFDEAQFIAALQAGHVDSITVFATCHHGWSYYPTEVGAPHPNLARKDLLGDMVRACRAGGINVPVYITVQWNERVAREHPEWRVVRGDAAGSVSDLNQMNANWHPLCLSNAAYIDLVIAQANEVMDRYRPDGLFFDILIGYDCCCRNCVERMRRDGLDPNRKEDRLANHRSIIMDYYARVTGAVHGKDPDMRVFHNSGHVCKGERERLQYYSHLELESLPTGGWSGGYDHFPLSARYVNKLGMEFLGMTGKFHTSWGEFGGYKRPAALEYECALMTALGARSSVGDQLHPSGRMDMDTYRNLGPAYARVRRLEEFAKGATPVSEVALLSAEAVTKTRAVEAHDVGCARMLSELQIMFDVIDPDEDFSRYKVLILPDLIALDEKAAKKVNDYVKNGGKLLLSGSSGMKPDGSGFAVALDASVDGLCDYSPDYLKADPRLDADLPESPFVMYAKAHKVKTKNGEVLAFAYHPYFNRTWEHFSSHQHTPYREEAASDCHPVFESGNILYIAYPVFKAYHDRGQPLYKYLVRGALKRLLPQRVATATLPSSGRLIHMEQKDKNRSILHLLYAETQMRGENGYGSSANPLKMLIIEDVNPLYSVTAAIRRATPPKRVYSALTNNDVAHHFENGLLTMTIVKLFIHEAIVIEG